jgi:hypothetical protein
MKNTDVLVVRCLPFLLFAIIGFDIIGMLLGMEFFDFYYLHSNSVFYALGLYGVSFANKRMHCRYNRYMILFLILTPIINYLDKKFCIFPNEPLYLVVVIGLYVATMIITAYLAIKHFKAASRLNKIRRLRNGNNNDNNG